MARLLIACIGVYIYVCCAGKRLSSFLTALMDQPRMANDPKTMALLTEKKAAALVNEAEQE